MIKTRKVSDKQLIAGLFREALFQNRALTATQKNRASDHKILEVKESSAKSKHEKKILYLRGEAHLQIDLNEPVELSCKFAQFIVNWSGFISENDSFLETEIPEEIEIKNYRMHKRIRPNQSAITIPLAIQTGALHAVELLELEDLSKNGIGGLIRSESGIPLSADSHVRGEWHSSTGIIKIDGRISQIRLLEQTQAGPVLYRVGISLHQNQSKQNIASPKGKRNFSRQKITKQLGVLSPINPHYTIELQLVDVSTAGFAAKISDPSDKHFLTVGAALRVSDSSLIAELLSIDDETHRFQIVAGSPEDRVIWLKKTISSNRKETYKQSGTGGDLIDLFCEAGAVSSQYIKNQANVLHSMTQGISSEKIEDTWIHRWIEKNSEGQIRGHICAVRISDGCWHVGEVAGSGQSDQKITKDFIPDFCTSFREFSVSASPCQKILLGWNHAHPYWKKFEEFLSKMSREYLLGHIKTKYTRSPRTKMEESIPDSWECQKVCPSDWKLISEIRSETKNEDALSLLTAFDFTKENFGSANLQKNILESESFFRRDYILFTNKITEETALVVFSQLPISSSVNQTLNTPWLIRLKQPKNSENAKEINCLHRKITRIGAANGFYFPGILEVINEPFNKNDQISKVMSWFIGHPDILLFFYNNHEVD